MTKRIRRFNLNTLLRENSQNNFLYLDHAKQVYSFKQDHSAYPDVTNSNWRSYLSNLPLLANISILESALLQGKLDINSQEEETLESNLEKHSMISSLLNSVDSLPKTYLVNSSGLESVEEYIKKFQRLNLGCESLQKIKNKWDLVCDVCFGGTHYLVTQRGNHITSYAKLASVVIDDKLYLNLNSMDSHSNDIQSYSDWASESMLGEFVALFYGATAITRSFQYEGLLFRGNGPSEFAKDLGISQKKFKSIKGSSIHSLKCGIKHKDTAIKGIYNSIESRNRFLSRNACYLSKHSLDTQLETLDNLVNLTPLQARYLEMGKTVIENT